jgi:hypothetical protein
MVRAHFTRVEFVLPPTSLAHTTACACLSPSPNGPHHQHRGHHRVVCCV